MSSHDQTHDSDSTDVQLTSDSDCPHDLTTLCDDLTAFQQDILFVLAEESRYGLAIKRALESQYDTEVNHGRLYPNLDTLATKGLVEKSEIDKRTNEYAISEDGKHWCRERVQQRLGQLNQEAAPTGGDD